MDIFKFNNPTNPTKMEQGEIINNIKSKMWIERYEKEGEFKLVADTRSGVREKLPIGTFISHTDTPEIMVVQNHEIKSNRNKPSDVVISGESFESFMKHRVTGAWLTFPAHDGTVGAAVGMLKTNQQARTLLVDSFVPGEPIDVNDEIPYVKVGNDAIAGTTTIEGRRAPWGNLDKEIRDLLSIDTLGIKVLRPGVWALTPISNPPGPNDIAMFVYKGVDRSLEIALSFDAEEIESAEYLWSDKADRNAAYVTGKWTRVRVVGGETGYFRKMVHIDGSKIDNVLSAAPTAPQQAVNITEMTHLANRTIAKYNQVFLTNVEISKKGIRWEYRKDYNVGDIITVNGEYESTGQFRVSEYVEIEDEDGVSGYPTLAFV